MDNDFPRFARHWEPTVEQLRKQLAKEFGVTVQGPYVTVRWYEGETLKQVSMIIYDVHDPDNEPDYGEDK